MAAPLADVSPERTGVAVVGLGHMGEAIAERILAAGYPLSVFNRSPGRDERLVAAGATRLGSAAAALAECDVCVTSLADDGAVAEAIRGERGVLAGARPGTTLVETSTISVQASSEIADDAAAAGVAYLRAPFSGNPAAIRSGAATLVVSGPAAAEAALRPLLEAIVPTVRYAGDGEHARVLKLVLQVMIGGTAGLLAEALTLGEAAGVERRALLETIGSSVAGSRFVEYKTEPLLADDYSATFTTAMAVKDLDLVLALAGATGADLRLTRELRTLLESACDHGHADEDFVSILLELKARSAGVETATKGG